MMKLATVAVVLAAVAVCRGDEDLADYDGTEDGYGGMDDYGAGGYGGMGGYGGYGGYGDYGGYGGGYGGYGGYGGEEAGPAFTTIDDIEGVEKFLQEEETEPAVIGFFNEDTNKADIEVFEEVASANRYSMRFAYTVEDDVRDHFKYKTGCTVLVFAAPRFVSDKHDKPKARFPGKSLSGEALTKFMLKKALPLVGQKTWKSGELYDAAKLPVVTLFTRVDLDKNPKGFDYYANRVRRVASEFKGKLVFNIGDKEDFSYLLEDYELDLPEKKDVGVGIKDDDKHYGMTESFSVDSLRAFCEAVLNGEITPKIKEEPDYSAGGYGDEEEEDDGDSAVVKVEDGNFDEVVMDQSKDVMIEFFAPWCGHCKQLKPEYKKLASKFEGVDSVTIAAMDATASEVPDGFDVQGYPTILFVPANSKEPVPYDGPRDVESMASFVKEHAGVPIKDEL